MVVAIQPWSCHTRHFADRIMKVHFTKLLATSRIEEWSTMPDINYRDSSSCDTAKAKYTLKNRCGDFAEIKHQPAWKQTASFTINYLEHTHYWKALSMGKNFKTIYFVYIDKIGCLNTQSSAKPMYSKKITCKILLMKQLEIVANINKKD